MFVAAMHQNQLMVLGILVLTGFAFYMAGKNK